MSQQKDQLTRNLGFGGAILMGLGSILGTGVFVSIGIVVLEAGALVVPATIAAGFLALCNALSSAQLAAAHPVSGGTYAYSRKYLNLTSGFIAGWLFLVAKSFSAATAALGFAAYILSVFGLSAGLTVPLAVLTVVVLTVLVVSGLKNTTVGNSLMVGIALLALAVFVIYGLGWAPGEKDALANLGDQITGDVPLFLQASALMFVAFTGYGRIATMGEEVKDPARTIPRVILATLGLSALVYGLVALVVAGVPREVLTRYEGAPLEMIAIHWEQDALVYLIVLGAATAMVGVLLNLILGLSRVLFAMGRDGEMPAGLGRVSKRGIPTNAEITMGVVIIALVLIGDIALAWSFSAFTVLGYYSFTNLCALRMPPELRRYPRIFSWLGLIGCVSLAWFVETRVWLIGLGIIALGLLWKVVFGKLRSVS